MRRVLLALVLVALPGFARASATRDDLRLMPLPEAVRAGQVVDLQWSEMPREVEELEILLSLDGGRTWRIRVSPELEADQGHYRWRVPDLPAGAARLRIRAGDGAGREWEGAPGETFRIEGSGRASEAERPLIERGWWFVRGGEVGAEAQGLAGQAPRLGAGAPAWAGAPIPHSTELEPPLPRSGRAAPPPPLFHARGGANRPRSIPPPVIPLRN